jgi:biopolymer transport protein ExbD
MRGSNGSELSPADRYSAGAAGHFYDHSAPPDGLPASLLQVASEPAPGVLPETILVQVASDGTMRLNGLVVQYDELRGRLERVFALRAHRVAFLQGARSLEFQQVVEVLDVMRDAGASPIALVTSELEKNR